MIRIMWVKAFEIIERLHRASSGGEPGPWPEKDDTETRDRCGTRKVRGKGVSKAAVANGRRGSRPGPARPCGEGASAGAAARRYGPVPAAAEPPRHIHASRPVLVCLGQGLGKRPALNPRPTPVAPGRNARGARPEGAWARPAKPCSRSVGRAVNLFGLFCQDISGSNYERQFIYLRSE